MGYYFRGRLQTSSDSPDYFAISGALSRSGFFDEVKTIGELRRRLDAAALSMPVGTMVSTERVYRMTRGYEPDKPRSGSVDREQRLVLVDKGSFYDPRTGKPRRPHWRTVERDQDAFDRRVR